MSESDSSTRSDAQRLAFGHDQKQDKAGALLTVNETDQAVRVLVDCDQQHKLSPKTAAIQACQLPLVMAENLAHFRDEVTVALVATRNP